MFLRLFLGGNLSIYLIGSFMAWDFNLTHWQLFIHSDGTFDSVVLRVVILLLFIISVVYGAIFQHLIKEKKK